MAAIFSDSIIKPIRGYFNHKLEQWLSKRNPSQKYHQLNNKNIMIYPTRFGLSYVAFVTLLFLLGTNYQNNIILLFSYLMASFFITVMLHSFFNFTQLQFTSVAEQQGYVGEKIYFPILITSKKVHFDLNIHFRDKSLTHDVKKIPLCETGNQEITLAYRALKRGELKLGRVVVFSEYSYGLFKSKTLLDFGHKAIIYPKAIKLSANQYQFSSQNEDSQIESQQTSNNVGTDDFFELKSFIKGESRARTAWKQLAKGQGHYSKHYQQSQGQLQWLKLDEMPSNNIETQLSYLSFLVTELSATNQSFGLLLYPDNTNHSLNICPDSGQKHQQACLKALALYS